MRLLSFLFLCFAYTEQREEHFIDVKELVKDTIQAIGQLPRAAAMGIPTMNFTTPAPAPQLYHLFKLPADIMTDLAVNAGYMEGSTTAATPRVPWIVTRESGDVYQNGQSETSQSSQNSGLLPISSLLPRMLGTPNVPNVPVSQLPQPPPIGQSSPSSTLPTLHHLSQLPTQSVSTPRYAYRPVVQPDGQTLFIPVLLPPTEPPTLEELMRQRVLAQTPQETEPVSFTSTVSPKTIRISSDRYEAHTFPPMVNPFYDRNAMKGIMSLTKEALQTAINTNIPNMGVPDFMKTTLIPQILTTSRPLNNRVRKVSSETEHQVDVINGPEDEGSTLVYESQAVPIPLDNSYHKKVTAERKTYTSVYNVDDSTTVESKKPPMIDERLAFQTKEDFERKEKNFLKKKIKKITPTKAVTETDLDAEAIREFDHISLTHTPSRNVNIRRVIPKADVPSAEFLGQMRSIPTDSEEAENDRKEQQSTTGRHVRHRIHSIKTYVVDRKQNSEKNGFTEPTEPINKQIEIEMERLGRLESTEDNIEEKVEDEEFLSDIEKQAEILTHKPTRVQPSVRKTITPTKTTEKPSRIHCLNIQNFSKQFGYSDVVDFAKEKCEYIENYYPRLPCRNVDLYMKECAQYY